MSWTNSNFQYILTYSKYMWKIFNQLFLLKVWNVFIEFQNHKMHLQFDKNQGRSMTFHTFLLVTRHLCSVVLLILRYNRYKSLSPSTSSRTSLLFCTKGKRVSALQVSRLVIAGIRVGFIPSVYKLGSRPFQIINKKQNMGMVALKLYLRSWGQGAPH